jgi:hypothetical protein
LNIYKNDDDEDETENDPNAISNRVNNNSRNNVVDASLNTPLKVNNDNPPPYNGNFFF